MGVQKSGIKIVAVNRKIGRLYELLERLEAGMVLTGSEIKSIRAGKISFQDAHVNFAQGEAFLVGMHIAPYAHAGYAGHDPDRARKLLLHKREIDALRGKVEQKGLTIVPTQVYLKQAKAKVEIALARGKKVHDRREELKQRAVQRDLAREMRKFKV